MLIGLVGPMEVGKSIAAEIFVQNRNFVCFSMAKRLKQTVATMFNIPVEWCDSAERKAMKIPGFPFTLRFALQTMGTEGARNHLGEDIWIKLADEDRKKTLHGTTKHAIFDDIRFRNEAEYIIREGGILVAIINPLEFQNKSVNHASEQLDWIKDADLAPRFYIENPKSSSSTKESFELKVKTYLGWICSLAAEAEHKSRTAVR